MPDHQRAALVALLKPGVGAADGYGVRALLRNEPGALGAVIGLAAPAVRR